MWISKIAVFGIALIAAAACSQQEDGSLASADNIDRPPETSTPGPTAAELVQRYKASRECEGKEYQDFMNSTEHDAGVVGSGPPELSTVMISVAEIMGHNMIDVAEEAASKGCLQTARKTYLAIIDTFAGTAYSALRQRAQIGIDDLRNGQPPANGQKS